MNNFNYYLTLSSILIAVLAVEIDSSIVNIALPTLTAQYSASSGQISMVVLLYFLAIVSFLLIFGKISDNIGKRKVFIAGYYIFLISSLLCGFSTNIDILGFFRFLQGIGGAMLITTCNALILINIQEEKRGVAYGAFGVFAGVGSALGPPLGGIIIKHLGWPWIFFINIVPCTLGILLSMKYLKKDEALKEENASFDYSGGFLSLIAITAVVLTLNMAQEKGWLSPFILSAISIFLISSVLFYLREIRIKNPIIEIDLFKNIDFSYGLLAKFSCMMLINGLLFVFPFFFERVMNMPTARVGLILGIIPVSSMIFSSLSGWLSDKSGTRIISITGSAIVLLSVVLFSFFSSQTLLPMVIVSFLFYGSALPLFLTSNSNQVMEESPPGKEGIVSSINALSIFLGGLIGVNVFETIFSYSLANANSGTTFMNAPLLLISRGYSYCIILAIILAALSLLLSILQKK